MDIFCDKHVQIKVTEATQSRFLKMGCVPSKQSQNLTMLRKHFVDENVM